MNTFHLQTPLTEDDIRRLGVGDIVYFSGKFFTCRTLFQKRALEQNVLPPLDFSDLNVMMHAGPVMRKTDAGWQLVTVAPTTSTRFEKFTPAIINKLGVRAIIGKATMGKQTLEALGKAGCVHLTVVGTPSGLLTAKVKQIIAVHGVEEMGITEATWVFGVADMGPFIVGMDSYGHNLFNVLQDKVVANLPEAYTRLGIPADYSFTPL